MIIRGYKILVASLPSCLYRRSMLRSYAENS